MSRRFFDAPINMFYSTKEQRYGYLGMLGAVSSILADTPRRQSWLFIVEWNENFMHGTGAPSASEHEHLLLGGLLASTRRPPKDTMDVL
jgi:hypothetical protein